MSEKGPLIPVAAPGRAETHLHVQRRSKGPSIGKLATVATAVALVYYGVPYGMLDIFETVAYVGSRSVFSWKDHRSE